MRLRLEISTVAKELPWASVLAPGRGIAYDLLASAAPDLAKRLHDDGWGPHAMVPMGHGAPIFPGARRQHGVYAAGGCGVLEFGSPLPDLVEAWARTMADRGVLDWGGVALRVGSVAVVDPPEFSSGHALLRTATPVVMKGSGRDEHGVRLTRQAWLLPTEPEFPAYFEQNLRRKAETLGLHTDVYLDTITWVGAKRAFAVSGGAKPGAPIEVEVRGAPEVLRAIWSWGLGQSNAAGFGWVAA